MGLYANFPFALSTGMGTNFLLGAMLQSGQLSFGAMMAIILISGVIFVLLSVFGIQRSDRRMIPKNIKVAISASIGFFIAYLGFKNTGIGTYADGIGMGDFTQPSVILALVGLLIIAVLTAFKVKGAILYGIVAVTVLGIPFGVTHLPASIFEAPSFATVSNVCFNFDFKGLLSGQHAGADLHRVFRRFLLHAGHCAGRCRQGQDAG